jgi:hypothetical protein
MIGSHKYNYRIGATESGLQLGHFFVWGIPYPDLAIFKNFSTSVNEAGGGESQHGFATVELTWNVLTMPQAKTIRDFIETVLAVGGGGDLYLTVDLSTNGNYAWGTWADIKGKPYRPLLVPTSGSQGLRIEDFTLKVNNVSIVNNPATGL